MKPSDIRRIETETMISHPLQLVKVPGTGRSRIGLWPDHLLLQATLPGAIDFRCPEWIYTRLAPYPKKTSRTFCNCGY